jgi:glycosyltransferase involved in cell wall biosynthesis
MSSVEKFLPADTRRTAKLKVLHVITGLSVGGAERSLALTLEGMRESVEDLMVVSLIPSGHYQDVISRMGIEVISLDMVRGCPSISGLIKLVRIIRRFRPDIVQSWMYHADLLSLFALWLSGLRRTTRLLWGVRCSDISQFENQSLLGLTVRLCALLSRAPDHIIVNSHAGHSHHAAIGYATKRMTVIHNGIQTARFQPDGDLRQAGRRHLGVRDSDFVVVMTARCHQMKDYPTFQGALALLPDVMGIAIGEGTDYLLAPANLRGIGVRHDVEMLLNAADVYVSSAAYGEGTSNAILEAMACGLPVVATDVGDSAFIVGEAGIIVPSNDPSAIAEAVKRIQNDPILRDRMKAAAIARVASSFHHTMFLQRFMSLYTRANEDEATAGPALTATAR